MWSLTRAQYQLPHEHKRGRMHVHVFSRCGKPWITGNYSLKDYLPKGDESRLRIRGISRPELGRGQACSPRGPQLISAEGVDVLGISHEGWVSPGDISTGPARQHRFIIRINKDKHSHGEEGMLMCVCIRMGIMLLGSFELYDFMQLLANELSASQ